MRRLSLPAAAILALLAPKSALAAEIKGTSRADAVIVFPSGAEVTRVAKVRLDRGEHAILIQDLPAEAVASSIRVEGKATGRLEIGSVDTRRVSVPRSDAAEAATERRRLEAEIEKLKDERAEVQIRVQAAETQKALITNLLQLPNRPPPQQGTAPTPESWGQLLGLVGTSLGEAQKAILDAQVRTRDLDRRIQDLERKMAAAAPAQEARTEVRVHVAAGGPLEADLAIRYQVPSAAWTPFYDARLSTGARNTPPKLTLVRRAIIQQRTGEPWSEVAIQLSTTRPGTGSAAPVLRPLIVDYEAESPPRPVASMPRQAPGSRAVGGAQREEGEGAKAKAAESAVPGLVIDAMETRADVQLSAFQAVFGVPGRLSIDTTGEAKRVTIEQAEIEPMLIVRTVPRLDAKAYLYAKLVLPRAAPILPGQVSLFRDATFVGTGRLPQLSPGEEHELGFGTDDSVRVRHAVLEEKRGEAGIISASKTDQRHYRITVKNLHERPMALVVLDQIPVSQQQDIKVELTGKSAPTKRDVEDRRGVLAWEAKLEPDEERQIEFGYRVTWPAPKAIIYGQAR